MTGWARRCRSRRTKGGFPLLFLIFPQVTRVRVKLPPLPPPRGFNDSVAKQKARNRTKTPFFFFGLPAATCGLLTDEYRSLLFFALRPRGGALVPGDQNRQKSPFPFLLFPSSRPQNPPATSTKRCEQGQTMAIPPLPPFPSSFLMPPDTF